ncbi:hypothetical protein N7532_005268 [Penicillium argentinense]|uniref:Uncharacterized protein n=1 Tax=Penicillium argentinense TaxID=1131581 RepID=A0A9W9KAR9_9EURO|nr:uncharacterized protein N7532_005268 [Penicillium argentinense]KAJ5098267.1 hypothetical protein N7532_005268 [Penicillium argentinense]
MVIPIQSRLCDRALTKASVLAPMANYEHAELSFSWGGSSFECSPLSTPSAPPPTPTDSLTDITPRKSSFSSEYGMGAACAFPSWPNRDSLSNADASDAYVNNAYLTDEDLLWMPENKAAEMAIEEPAPKDERTALFCSMDMEQQLKLIRAAAEEDDRARFMAKVEAHARATQAVRQAKMTRVPEPESKRRKRRPVLTPKRRAHSSSAKVVTST